MGAAFAWRDPSQRTNYTSVDCDPAAEPEVDRIANSGFVKVFESLEVPRRHACDLEACARHETAGGWRLQKQADS